MRLVGLDIVGASPINVGESIGLEGTLAWDVFDAGNWKVEFGGNLRGEPFEIWGYKEGWNVAYITGNLVVDLGKHKFEEVGTYEIKAREMGNDIWQTVTVVVEPDLSSLDTSQLASAASAANALSQTYGIDQGTALQQVLNQLYTQNYTANNTSSDTSGNTDYTPYIIGGAGIAVVLAILLGSRR